ncbi:MAG: heme exporter protein CcmB [Cyclobacteriaceae bacterium]
MTNILGEIRHLLWKDLSLELKSKHTLSSIILFSFSTIFVCYLSFLNIVDQFTWNALFWIIIMFSATNSIARSFTQEGESRFLYYYFMVRPQSVIIAKALYNSMITLLIALLSFMLYLVIMGNPVQNIYLFIVGIILGVIGFALPMTMVAAISSKAGNNPVMMSILSFPIVIPVIINCIKISKIAIDGLDVAFSYDEMAVLISIDVISIILSVILFPYLWKN